jgi:hypothetical protein
MENSSTKLVSQVSIKVFGKLDVFKSSKSGKLYACKQEDGTFVGMLSEDLDRKKPMFVITVQRDDEVWAFIGNSEREYVETLG